MNLGFVSNLKIQKRGVDELDEWRKASLPLS